MGSPAIGTLIRERRKAAGFKTLTARRDRVLQSLVERLQNEWRSGWVLHGASECSTGRKAKPWDCDPRHWSRVQHVLRTGRKRHHGGTETRRAT